MKFKLELTNTCNLRCKHCANIENISSEVQKKLDYKLVYEKFGKMISSVDLMGGEPTTVYDIKDVVKFFTEKNIETNIISNGQANEQTYLDIIDNGISTIVISMEGPEIIHDKIRGLGTYKKALRVLNQIDNYKAKNNVDCKVGVNYVLTAGGNDELVQWIMSILPIIDFIQISPLIRIGNAEANFEEMKAECKQELDLYERLLLNPKVRLVSVSPMVKEYLNKFVGVQYYEFETQCEAGESYCCIDYKGNVFPCNVFKEKKYSCNIYMHNMREIFNNFSSFYLLKENEKRECECKYNLICCACPLANGNKKTMLCEEAERRLEIWNYPEDKKVYLPEPYVIVKNQEDTYYFLKKGEAVTYQEEGMLVMKAISEGKNIGEIKNLLSIRGKDIEEFIYEQLIEGNLEEGKE